MNIMFMIFLIVLLWSYTAISAIIKSNNNFNFLISLSIVEFNETYILKICTKQEVAACLVVALPYDVPDKKNYNIKCLRNSSKLIETFSCLTIIR